MATNELKSKYVKKLSKEIIKILNKYQNVILYDDPNINGIDVIEILSSSILQAFGCYSYSLSDRNNTVAEANTRLFLEKLSDLYLKIKELKNGNP